MQEFLETAVKVAKLAGDRLREISERRVNSDAGNDVKLQEDVESEIFIRRQLARPTYLLSARSKAETRTF